MIRKLYVDLCMHFFFLICFFLECVVCFCYLYYIIIMMMMIISVWQRDTSCFHWYILLCIKLWNLLLFCYGWICRVVLHDNLFCCSVIVFFLVFAPSASLLCLTLRVRTKGFLKSSFSLQNFSSPMISEYVKSSITTFLALDCEFKWTGWSYQIHIPLIGFLQDVNLLFPPFF